MASRELTELVKFLERSNRNMRVTMSEIVNLLQTKYEQKCGSV